MNVLGQSTNTQVQIFGPDTMPEWLAGGYRKHPLWRNALAHDPRWLAVLRRGLRHATYWLMANSGEASAGEDIQGVLPLAYLRSALFGKFLVSLPYLNRGGVCTHNAEAAQALIDKAVQLADSLDVRYLELRHEAKIEHPRLNHQATSKVHMRLPLPDDANVLWSQFKPKVRNQIRKSEEHALTIHFGQAELLPEFYAVFSRNMRDLGTPVYSAELFAAILGEFRDEAELCVVRSSRQPVAGALLIHGPNSTEVPSASSLRAYNATNANMLMYWNLLRRAIERRQPEFDFGRSSIDSGTFRFKKQWGAQPTPAVWQYYIRQGNVEAMRPDSARNRRLVKIWQRLPVWLTRKIGPAIVRGIP